MKFKAVLFDLDGTLLDTIQDIAESMNEVLDIYNFPAHPVEAYNYFVGNGVEELARRVLPEGCRDQKTVSACVSALRSEYGRRWLNNTRPYEGVPELLDALVARGSKLSVLSNKPDDFTKIMVAGLLPRWPFEPVLGARPSVPKKPDPAGALEIARQLSLPPEDFLYLGDTGTDMKTAGAAGMYPVGALWGLRTAEELQSNGARIIIKKPVELLDILS
ncbi:MAG: HAD family hydrolase [Actinobacteria bacterium]|nr:HAD family hydrolase [Actinomycetota bacterium]